MHDPHNKDLCETAKTRTRPPHTFIGSRKNDMAESDRSMEKLSLGERRELAAKEVEALQLEEEIAGIGGKKKTTTSEERSTTMSS